MLPIAVNEIRSKEVYKNDDMEENQSANKYLYDFREIW
uniref:Uncharacterized protein n=1 Tax=virus sp. ctrcb4 TaxID=2825824 RepID=A0A8S5RQ80_9VIRU|nr:MAG TPA: hypothetical protein [virus sp. ctrcb4]DAH01339.1 MAG TPA: hypothetical protein [Crassvirales sp.]DAR12691.1 MAG TPA: hypothetical protein [Crassvirales sp.]